MFLHTTLLPVILVILFWNACRDLIRKNAFILQDILLLHPDKKNSHSGSLKNSFFIKFWWTKSKDIQLKWQDFSDCGWILTQNLMYPKLVFRVSSSTFHVDEEMKYSTDTKKNACPPNSCYKKCMKYWRAFGQSSLMFRTFPI